jgi:predicted HicB family RNase H-like nuclease
MTQDNRVTIELDLDQDLLYQLMLKAHEHDITLNQLIEKILREYLDKETGVS